MPRKFELREAVTYKRRIYVPGDEAKLPDELVKTLKARYKAEDAEDKAINESYVQYQKEAFGEVIDEVK